MANDKNSVMLVVAGFFGSLIAVGKASHGNMRDNLLYFPRFFQCFLSCYLVKFSKLHCCLFVSRCKVCYISRYFFRI